MAHVSDFEIVVTGKGVHASQPQKGIDTVLIALDDRDAAPHDCEPHAAVERERRRLADDVPGGRAHQRDPRHGDDQGHDPRPEPRALCDDHAADRRARPRRRRGARRDGGGDDQRHVPRRRQPRGLHRRGGAPRALRAGGGLRRRRGERAAAGDGRRGLFVLHDARARRQARLLLLLGGFEKEVGGFATYDLEFNPGAKRMCLPCGKDDDLAPEEGGEGGPVFRTNCMCHATGYDFNDNLLPIAVRFCAPRREPPGMHALRRGGAEDVNK